MFMKKHSEPDHNIPPKMSEKRRNWRKKYVLFVIQLSWKIMRRMKFKWGMKLYFVKAFIRMAPL